MEGLTEGTLPNCGVPYNYTLSSQTSRHFSLCLGMLRQPQILQERVFLIG